MPPHAEPPTIGRISNNGVPLIPHGFIERSRLAHILDAARNASLVIIRGSGGSGKSGLVASWLREETQSAARLSRNVWVSLDDGARSRAGFWRRVVRSFHTAGDLNGDSPLSSTSLEYAELDELPGLFLDQLELDGIPTRLILDDFHLVNDSNATDIVWLLKQSRWLSVIITTRRVGSFEAVDVASRIHTIVITEKSLAFTAEETRDLFASATQFSAEHALVVHAASKGHPLAIRIAVTLLTQRPETVTAALADVGELTRQLADHIAQTLLPAFADDVRLNFASLVSLAPELPIALASALTGRSERDAEALLTEFANGGLGEFRLAASELVFRFHPLVCEALRIRATQTLSVEKIRTARTQSASYFSEHGNGLEALKLFIAANEFDRVWPTMARHFSELINFQQDELHSLLSSIPLETLLRHSTAAISLAIVMSERERIPSARLLQLVSRGIEDASSATVTMDQSQFLLRSLALFAGYRAARRYDDAADAGDNFVALVQALDPATLAATRHAIGAGIIQIVITNILLGRWDRAKHIAHLMSVDDHRGRAQHRASLLAYIHAFTGHIPEAVEKLGEVSPFERRGWRTTVPSVGWHIAVALRDLEAKAPVQALEALSALKARLNHLENWPFVVWSLARARLATGDAQVALDEFDAAIRQNEFRPLSDYARAQLQATKADLHLALRQNEHAKLELDNIHATGGAFSPLLSRSRLALATGDSATAHNLLDLDHIQVSGTTREFAEALLLTACMRTLMGRDTEAVQTLRRAADILTRHALTSPVAMIPHAELRALCAREAPELEYIFDGIENPFALIALVNPLTPREQEVLAALATHSSLDDVARTLFVSINTVKSQLRAAYRKLGVRSRAEALRVASERGFISSR